MTDFTHSFIILSPDAFNLYMFAFFAPFFFLIITATVRKFWFF